MPAAARGRGFTLVELMITLAIGAIILGVGLPSFSGFVRGQGSKTASMDLTSALLLTRSEAIKRNTNVVLASASGGWINGWTVTVTSGGATTTLNSHAAFSGLTIDGPDTSITYGNNGRLQNTSAPEFEITGGSSVRCVSVTLSGLPATKTGSCS